MRLSLTCVYIYYIFLFFTERKKKEAKFEPCFRFFLFLLFKGKRNMAENHPYAGEKRRIAYLSPSFSFSFRKKSSL